MKTSIQHRPATIQRIGIGPKLLILCLGLLVAGLARADVVVEGRKLPWTATIPSGWVGGTAEKIEEMLAKGGADQIGRDLDKILKAMLADSKRLDAFFYHLDMIGAETKTVSSLRVNVVPINLDPYAEEARRKTFWGNYAKELATDFPQGSVVEVEQDRSAITAGHKAYEATFLTTLSGGGKVYTVIHLVAYSTGKTHIFQLKADGQKFRARVAELAKILSSLKYRPE